MRLLILAEGRWQKLVGRLHLEIRDYRCEYHCERLFLQEIPSTDLPTCIKLQRLLGMFELRLELGLRGLKRIRGHSWGCGRLENQVEFLAFALVLSYFLLWFDEGYLGSDRNLGLSSPELSTGF